MNNDTTATAQIIPFRKKELLLVDSGGQPFVPMKLVVDGMGLDWKSQYAKLQGGRFNSTMVMITTVAGDGKRREMACLPLRKLAGWLMSIHASKVRPDLRDNVIAYQNECDDALWSYWNDGIAIRRDECSAASVLSTTIGTDGFHCLGAVLEGKVRHLPARMRTGAKNHIWPQVRKAFSVVSVEDIPASSMDSARNFIGAYTLEGEWLKREPLEGFGAQNGRPLGLTERWMVCRDGNGAEQYKLIPLDANVMTYQQLITEMLTPGQLCISIEEMFGFVADGMQYIKERADHQSKLLKMRARAH